VVYRSGCLICGSELIYQKTTRKLECYYCKTLHDSNVECRNGHFVCDKCHSLSAIDLIEKFCANTVLEDPLEIAITLMRNPKVKMHGPEHHFLVPAVLLAAYYNVMNDQGEKVKKIGEARKRAEKVLGGFCGYYGDCGASVGTGIFVSLITNATPLSKSEWRLCNLMTSRSLLSVASYGGPRCCKRNSFIN
jgi:hypothetical protein